MDLVARTLALSAIAQGAVSIERFGARPFLPDNTAAIQAALNSGEPRIYVPPFTYKHAGVLYIKKPNVEFFGVRGLSCLSATDATNTSLYVQDTSNVHIHDLKLTCSATVRKQGMVSHKVSIVRSSMVTVEKVDVDGSSAAGILMSQSKQIWVRNNTVKNTLADGIHVTNNSRDIFINGNWTYNTGDDSIAIVSYQSNATANETIDVTITGPATTSGTVYVVLDGSPLGIAVTSGQTADTIAANIRAATKTGWTISGSGPTATFIANAKAEMNVAFFNDGGTGVTASVVTRIQGDGYCDNVIAEGNQIYNSTKRGMTFVGGGFVIFNANIIDGTSSSGMLIMQDNSYQTFEPRDIVISNNTIRNSGSWRKPGDDGNQYGIEIQAASRRVTIIGNQVSFSRSRGFSVTGNNHIISGNRAFRNFVSGFELQGNFIDFANNYAFENGQQGFSFVNCVDLIISACVAMNNNTQGSPGVDNFSLNSCSKVSLSGNNSVDNRGGSEPHVRRTYSFADCVDIRLSSNRQDAGSINIGFSGTCTDINIADGLVGTTTPSETVYSPGVRFTKTDTNELFVFMGATNGWKKAVLS